LIFGIGFGSLICSGLVEFLKGELIFLILASNYDLMSSIYFTLGDLTLWFSSNDFFKRSYWLMLNYYDF